jgi:hypothetical protein
MDKIRRNLNCQDNTMEQTGSDFAFELYSCGITSAPIQFVHRIKVQINAKVAGVVVATYSSIFITSPIVAELESRRKSVVT